MSGRGTWGRAAGEGSGVIALVAARHGLAPGVLTGPSKPNHESNW